MPLPEDEFKKGSVKELQAFDDFRVRILPVIGMLTHEEPDFLPCTGDRFTDILL